MKIFYLLLILSLSALEVIKAMEEDFSWLQKIDCTVIRDAIDKNKIIMHNESGDPFGAGVEITAQAFVDDDAELIEFLFSQAIPIKQKYSDLIKLVIKKGSVKIIKVFEKQKILGLFSLDEQNDWILKAIKKNQIELLKLLLNEFRLPVDKSNNKFTESANSSTMRDWLKDEGFSFEQSAEYEDILDLKSPRRHYSTTNTEQNEDLYKKLFEYIELNDSTSIQKLLQSTNIFEIYRYNVGGETPVTLAVKSNCDTNIINILAQYGADLDLPNLENFTPLVIAVINNNLEMINTLLNLNAHPNLECEDLASGTKRTALMWALKFGFNEAAKTIALHPKTNLNHKDNKGRTALTHALLTKNTEMKDLLIKIDISPENKATALQFAVEKGNINEIESMLKLGADPNYPIEHSTALECAVKKQRNYKIIKFFLESAKISENNKSLALRTAIKKKPKALENIKILLEAGARPNTLFDNGTPVLIFAAYMGYIEVLKELLKYGADPYLMDKRNRSALMLAASRGQAKIIYELCEFEQKKTHSVSNFFTFTPVGINNQDNDGNTALMYAALACCPICIRLLMIYNSNACLINNNNESALSILAKLNPKDIFQKILKISKSFIYNSANHIEDEEQTEENQYDTYFSLYEIMSEISEQNSNPLDELLSLLEKKISSYEGQEKLMFTKVGKLLESLVQEETEKIYKCCSIILEYDKSALNHLDNDKNNLVTQAILNDNLAAVKAFIPYLSKVNKNAAHQVALACKNCKISELLDPKFDNSMCLIS